MTVNPAYFDKRLPAGAPQLSTVAIGVAKKQIPGIGETLRQQFDWDSLAAMLR